MRLKSPLSLALLALLTATFSACDPLGAPPAPSVPDAADPALPGTGPLPAGRTLPDGARAVAPDVAGDAIGSFARLPDAGQPLDAEHAAASAAYRVTVPEAADRSAPLILAIPVDQAALPAGWQAAGLRAEVRGPDGWRTVAAMGRFDEAQGLYWCRLLPPASPAADEAGDVPASGYGVTQATGEWVTEIRLAYLLSAMQTVHREGSRFRINYYPSQAGQKHTVPLDADWPGGGHAVDARIPDYIEDLDAALEEAYDGLMRVKRTGKDLFTAPSLPIEVTVTDTGGEAGNSDLGGPIEIGARAISDYEDLRSVAAHELVHLLQGQFYSTYGLFSGRLNTWFIEATANHLAARVLAMSPERRRAFYGDALTTYLSVPLNAADAGSMYAAAHFLDHLVARTDDLFIGDVMAGPRGNDLTAIGQALRGRGIQGGVGAALGAYVEEIVRTPQGTAGLHQVIKAALESQAVAQGHVAGTSFFKDAAHRRIQRTLPPLATFYAGFLPRYANEGLLVVRSSASQGASLDSVAFDVVGADDAAYTGRLAVDRYDEVPASRPWLFRKFGPRHAIRGAEWAVTNTSAATSAKLEMDAYVLPHTFSSEQEPGVVSWDASTAASIPKALLVGWRIFDGDTELTKKPVPVAEGGGTQSFSHPVIDQHGLVGIALQDVEGNVWPARDQYVTITPSNPDVLKPGEAVSLSARIVGRADQEVTWTFEAEDPRRPGAFTTSGNQLRFSPPNVPNDTCTGVTFTATTVSTPTISRSYYVSVCGPVTIEACVPGSTAVALAGGGSRPIAQVRVGDRVLALGEDGHSLMPAVVRKVLVHADQPAVVHRLTTRLGDDLRITGNHPVLVAGRGWVPVEAVKAGEELFVLDPTTGELVKTPLLSLVREEGTTGIVYNLKTSRDSYLAAGVMVHNKCLAAGSPIDTPTGPRAVEAIAVGDLVWGEQGGRRVATRVTHRYRKDVAAAALPGRLVAPGVRVTDNHPIAVAGRLVPAGSAGLPAAAIAGPVYDLRTEAGTYFAGGRLMATGDE